MEAHLLHNEPSSLAPGVCLAGRVIHVGCMRARALCDILVSPVWLASCAEVDPDPTETTEHLKGKRAGSTIATMSLNCLSYQTAYILTRMAKYPYGVQRSWYQF